MKVPVWRATLLFLTMIMIPGWAAAEKVKISFRHAMGGQRTAFIQRMVEIIAAPVLLAFIFSTQTPAQIFSYPPKFTFGSALVENYRTVWSTYHLGHYMLNSIFIALAVTVGKTLISFMAATPGPCPAPHGGRLFFDVDDQRHHVQAA
jgi:hypothetical protein